MEKSDNVAEYSPGKFTMDLTEVEWIKDDQVTEETFPIFAHEYCHYIQDISTISGIAGFYYRIIDVAELTKITCDGSGKIIKIPVQMDSEGHPIRKNQKLYAYYCGDVTTFNDMFTFDTKSKETIELPIGKKKLNIPVFRIYPSGHSEILVGIYALQEAQAFYIQKMIESEIRMNPDKKNIEFKIPSDSLPKYPYKFVDYLFDTYKINASDRIKAYIIDLCLDTYLPMVTLIELLEILEKIGITEDENRLYDIVLEASLSLRIPLANDIQSIIVEFLKGLIEDKSRPSLTKGINWYLETINRIREIRNKRAYWISNSLNTLSHIKGFMTKFQPPVVIKNNQISYFKFNINSQDILDSVTGLFLYMHVFSFTTEIDKEKFFRLVDCPLFENCQIRKNIKSDYICKKSPWTISDHHKEKGKVCFYRAALQELGLDQNKIEIDSGLFNPVL